MSTWQDAPDASGLWWVRREGKPDDVLRVCVDADGVMLRDEDGDWHTLARYPNARWCRVVVPDTHAEIVRERDHYRERAAEHHRRGDEARHEAATLRRRVEAVESALRSVIDNEADTTTPWCARCCVEWDDPYHDKDGWCHIGHAIAVLREGVVAQRLSLTTDS